MSFGCHRTRSFSTRSATSSACTLNPPEAAVVLCVDEKTQVQALDRTVAQDLDVHVICDNQSAHKTPAASISGRHRT